MEEHLFLGRYKAVRLLGEGGMGSVYLARQLDQDRQVVVKVLHSHLVSNPHYREAFRREVEFMSRFRHRCAVELFEASVNDPHEPCAVMEYVDGILLDELLERHRRLPAKRVGLLLGPLCGVLQAAHSQGIIHRDLKPGNLMVVAADTPEERIKVLDFGLGKQVLAPSNGLYIPMEKFTASTPNPAVGTPEYTCPEQFRGQEVDHRGDIYSLGVILYELLTGCRPFSGQTAEDIVSAHVFQAPPLFITTAWDAGILPAVEKVVMDCLAKDPGDRPQSAKELALAYGNAIGQAIWVDEESPPPMVSPAATNQPAQEVLNDPHVLVGRLEAWMPESVAVVKLRGFLGDLQAQVVQTVPGLVRVLLHRPRDVALQAAPNQRFLSRLGLAKKPVPVQEYDQIDLEVHMCKTDPDKELFIEVRFRPAGGGPLPENPDWHAWCDKIHGDLGSYLMAKII
jgi:serine/threonine-protein kinase